MPLRFLKAELRPRFRITRAVLAIGILVYRRPGLSDTLCLKDEQPPTPDSEALMVVVMEGGERIGERDPLAIARARFERDRSALADEQADLERPVHAEPVISSALQALQRKAGSDARAQAEEGDRAGGQPPGRMGGAPIPHSGPIP